MKVKHISGEIVDVLPVYDDGRFGCYYDLNTKQHYEEEELFFYDCVHYRKSCPYSSRCALYDPLCDEYEPSP